MVKKEWDFKFLTTIFVFRGEQEMKVDTFRSFVEFGLDLTGVRHFLLHALESDEIMSEFASRNIKKKNLQELLEVLDRTANVFYDRAQPV